MGLTPVTGDDRSAVQVYIESDDSYNLTQTIVETGKRSGQIVKVGPPVAHTQFPAIGCVWFTFGS